MVKYLEEILVEATGKYMSMDNLKYFGQEDQKVYYNGSTKIGTEFDMVKVLISSGMSSSKAHKMVKKIKKGKK